MKKTASLKKILAVVLAMLMTAAVFPTAFAADTYRNGELYIEIERVSAIGDEITVYGTHADDGKGSIITLMLTDGSAPSYIDGNILALKIEAVDPASVEGWRPFPLSMSIKVPDSLPTGTYTIFAGTTKSEETVSMKVDYLGYEDRVGLMELINSDGVSAEALANKLVEMPEPLTVDSLGSDGSAFKELSHNGKVRYAELLLEYIEQYKAEMGIDEVTFANINVYSREALLLSTLDSSYAENSGYKIAFNLFKSISEEMFRINPETDNYFKRVFNADNFVKAIKAQHPDNFHNTEEVRAVIRPALYFAALNETAPTAYLDFIRSNNNFFQVPDEELTKARRNTRVSNYYGEALRAALPAYTLDEFKEVWQTAMEKAEADYRKYINGGNGGGGGGGGGGGSTGGHTVGETGSTSQVFTVNPAGVRDDPLDKKLLVNEMYDDLAGYDWAFEAIYNLTKDNIVSGTGNKKFEPARTLKREEFMKLLVNTFDLADMKATSSFTDVSDKNAWYYMYIASAEKAGITSGRGDGTFGVGDEVTREEMATLIYRAAQKTGVRLVTNVGNMLGNQALYSDVSSLSPYAVEAVMTLTNTGVMSGSDGKFSPKEGASRAQAAVVIHNVINIK